MEMDECKHQQQAQIIYACRRAASPNGRSSAVDGMSQLPWVYWASLGHMPQHSHEGRNQASTQAQFFSQLSGVHWASLGHMPQHSHEGRNQASTQART
eukprot:809104-Pelagomonas_calceolata.AAC.7